MLLPEIGTNTSSFFSKQSIRKTLPPTKLFDSARKTGIFGSLKRIKDQKFTPNCSMVQTQFPKLPKKKPQIHQKEMSFPTTSRKKKPKNSDSVLEEQKPSPAPQTQSIKRRQAKPNDVIQGVEWRERERGNNTCEVEAGRERSEKRTGVDTI